MKFSNITYSRPDIKALQEKFNHLVSLFENAENFEEQDALIKDINSLRMEFMTQNTISSIKYSIDTNNKEFEQEQEFFDANSPIYEGLIHRYYKAIANSRFRRELEEKWGKQLFDVAEVSLRTFSPEILEDL